MINKHVEQIGVIALANDKGELGVICSNLESEYGGGVSFLVKFKNGDLQRVTIKVEEI